MQSKHYIKDELREVQDTLKRFEITSKPVETRPFIVDFSEPVKANQWIDEMRGPGPQNGPLPRPAGIIGQIKYYKQGQKESSHNTYQFLLSSQNNQAAITDLLNFECRTPKAASEDETTYQTTEYFDIVEVMRGQPDEVGKFATNILRLIKGTSFSKKEKGLIGLKKTIDCALDFVAILFSAECLRDPRSKYLAMSEFYKLKKGEIDINALFHPLYGRYVPARIIEAKFLEKFADKWSTIPKEKRSKIEPNLSKGGAQQMRDVSSKQIREHFFDEQMQNFYQREIKPPGEEESSLREKIEAIEEEWENHLEEYKMKRDKRLEEEEEKFQTDIRKIEGGVSGKEKQKAEIAKRKTEYEKAIESIQNEYEFESEKLEHAWRWSEFQGAKKELEKLEDYSFSGFLFWVLLKFEKAHSICQKIKNE